jgi:linoleoyl-CoA desaturase
MPRVVFDTTDPHPFAAEVKLRVADYFEKHNLSPHANAGMVIKTVIIVILTLGSYGLILSGWFPPMAMLGLAVLMGVGVAGIGFCVAHDSLHGAYSARPGVNRALGWSLDCVGGSSYLWKLTHNVIHHTYTNVHGLDEDLEVSALLRLSPHSKRHAIHRFQHLYGFLTYALATLNWVFLKDYRHLFRRDLGPFEGKSHRVKDVLALFGGKLFYYGWVIVIPLLVLQVPWWQFLIGFVAMHLTAGLILGVVFQLAHVVEDTRHPVADEKGRMERSWVIHQMETTSNFANGSRWITWYVAGLNHQVEHHLFPRICSVHYPAISKIVREVAERHGVPYHGQPTLAAAIRSHYEMLRVLGREPATATA